MIMRTFQAHLLGEGRYDLLPGVAHRPPLSCRHNTPLHHDMHHARQRGNFGLYFNLRDRLMGSNLGDYDEQLERFAERVRKPDRTAARPDSD